MRKLALFGLMVALSFTLAFGCEKGDVGEGQTPAGEVAKEAGAAPTAAVSAATVTIGNSSWTCEVASTNEQRVDGLSGRSSLAPNAGMWFVFPSDTQDPFWMRDTQFNLDMVFVDSNNRVVFTSFDNQAGSLDLIQPPQQYRYVLEANAGEAASVAVGDTVQVSMGPAQ